MSTEKTLKSEYNYNTGESLVYPEGKGTYFTCCSHGEYIGWIEGVPSTWNVENDKIVNVVALKEGEKWITSFVEVTAVADNGLLIVTVDNPKTPNKTAVVSLEETTTHQTRVEAAKKRYSDKETLAAHINSQPTLLKKYAAICRGTIVCHNPEGRFGLRLEETVHLVPFLQELKADLEIQNKKAIKAAYRLYNTEGLDVYETMARLTDLGYNKDQIAFARAIITNQVGPVLPCKAWTPCVALK